MTKHAPPNGPRARADGSDADPGHAAAKTAARPTIDTNEFCRLAQTIEDTTPVARLPRLAADLFDETGQVDWRLRGWQTPGDDGGVQRRMHLHLAVQCAVHCDRCLQRLPIAYEIERDYLLMRTEKQAAEVDADIDDYDVLVASPRFDVLELVEDEAIMAQPQQAEHEDCALPVELDADEPYERPNPFAALAALREPGGGGNEAGGLRSEEGGDDGGDEKTGGEEDAPR